MSCQKKTKKPQGKPWYKSKTVWVNVATVVAAMLTGIEQYLSVLAPVIDPMVMPWLLVGVGVVNIVLRAITTEGITGVTGTES
jgi:hypothetical protein